MYSGFITLRDSRRLLYILGTHPSHGHDMPPRDVNILSIQCSISGLSPLPALRVRVCLASSDEVPNLLSRNVRETDITSL